MKLIEQGYEILSAISINGVDELSKIENAARTCYKSELNNNGDFEKTKSFVKGIIKRGHEAMIEHSFLSVKFITDRSIANEFVRARLFSYAQESTRYCNYNNDDIVFIKPFWYDNASPNDKMAFEEHLNDVERLYKYLVDGGHKPQEARAILPCCLKTELVVSGNYREWRHTLGLRATKKYGNPHPDIYNLTRPLLDDLVTKIPIIFDDLLED